MRHFLLLIVSIVFIAASACSVVTVTEPIGEEPVQVQPKEWEGLWKIYPYNEKEEFFLIEVSDGENGVLEVTGIGRESKTFPVYLREIGRRSNQNNFSVLLRASPVLLSGGFQ